MSSGIHTKKGTYRKANWALGLSALGLVSAYPFQGLFWGGLLTSGCTAALVGGLADWFAVNALFRRPLGIRPGRVFRTDIIPRNRERIYSALSDMVQNELLSQEALRNKLITYDFAAPVIKIWEAEGRQGFESPLTQVLQQVLPNLRLSVEGLDKELNYILGNEEFQKANLTPLVGEVLTKILESVEGKKALETVMRCVGVWTQGPEVHDWLVRWIENSISRYVNENPSRKFLTMFLPDPSALGSKLQDQIEGYLLISARNEVPTWLKKKVDELCRINSTSLSEVYNRVLQHGMKTLHNVLTQTFEAPQSASKISRLLLDQGEEWAAKLKNSPEERRKFNAQVQALILPLIENQHERIGKIVQEGLERYSDEKLVELIESKAGDDLQMIRINGSVVGGLAGMLFFLVNWLL